MANQGNLVADVLEDGLPVERIVQVGVDEVDAKDDDCRCKDECDRGR